MQRISMFIVLFLIYIFGYFYIVKIRLFVENVCLTRLFFARYGNVISLGHSLDFDDVCSFYLHLRLHLCFYDSTSVKATALPEKGKISVAFYWPLSRKVH